METFNPLPKLVTSAQLGLLLTQVSETIAIASRLENTPENTNVCMYKKTAGPSGRATLKTKTNCHETNESEAITVLQHVSTAAVE